MDKLVKRRSTKIRAEYRYQRKRFLCRRTKWNKHDQRKPGLFKQEWEGSAMIALGSKCYFGLGRNGGKNKLASKGVSKRNRLTDRNYLRVLFSRHPHYIINKGLRVYRGSSGHHHQARVHRYDVAKTGLNYFYIKRVVQPDGIKTRPLLI
jgi:hypothetical protein